MTTKALILLSGGMDSVMALLWARRAYDVEAIAVHYGQRHYAELRAAWDITKALGVPFETLEFQDFAAIAPSRLTGRADTYVVPNRNMMLLSVAGAVAIARGIDTIIVGCNGDDAADFPDCRPAFLDAAESVLRTASGRGVHIVAPWLHMTKAEALASVRWGVDELGAIRRSVSCYAGSVPGCGACPACMKRAAAFASCGISEEA